MLHPIVRIGLPALLVAGVVGGALFLRGGPARGGGDPGAVDPGVITAPGAGETSPGTPLTPAKPVAGTPAGPKVEPKGIGRRGTPPPGAAVFPDGTWLPPLNGVTHAPPFPGFAPGHPYAPVVEIITGEKGMQWYRHADGTHSNTQMVLTEMPGREPFTQPGWAVGNPTKPLPIQAGPGIQAGQDAGKTGKDLPPIPRAR